MRLKNQAPMGPTTREPIQTEFHATDCGAPYSPKPDRVEFTQQFYKYKCFSALVSPPKPPPSEAPFSYRLGGLCFILGGETHRGKTTPPIHPHPLGSGTRRSVAMTCGHTGCAAGLVAFRCGSGTPGRQLNRKGHYIPLTSGTSGAETRTAPSTPADEGLRPTENPMPVHHP